jgi:hypothetical protein
MCITSHSLFLPSAGNTQEFSGGSRRIGLGSSPNTTLMLLGIRRVRFITLRCWSNRWNCSLHKKATLGLAGVL